MSNIKLKILLGVVMVLITFCFSLVAINKVQNVKLEKARTDLENMQMSNAVLLKESLFENEKRDIVSNFAPIKIRIEKIEDEELSYELKNILFDVSNIYHSSFSN